MKGKDKEKLRELSEKMDALGTEEYQYLIGYAQGVIDTKEKVEREANFDVESSVL